MVDKKVNFNNPANILLTNLTLSFGLALISIQIGTLTLTGMTLAACVAIILSITFKIFNISLE